MDANTGAPPTGAAVFVAPAPMNARGAGGGEQVQIGSGSTGGDGQVQIVRVPGVMFENCDEVCPCSWEEPRKIISVL